MTLFDFSLLCIIIVWTTVTKPLQLILKDAIMLHCLFRINLFIIIRIYQGHITRACCHFQYLYMVLSYYCMIYYSTAKLSSPPFTIITEALYSDSSAKVKLFLFLKSYNQFLHTHYNIIFVIISNRCSIYILRLSNSHGC